MVRMVQTDPASADRLASIVRDNYVGARSKADVAGPPH